MDTGALGSRQKGGEERDAAAMVRALCYVKRRAGRPFRVVLFTPAAHLFDKNGGLCATGVAQSPPFLSRKRLACEQVKLEEAGFLADFIGTLIDYAIQ